MQKAITLTFNYLDTEAQLMQGDKALGFSQKQIYTYIEQQEAGFTKKERLELPIILKIAADMPQSYVQDILLWLEILGKEQFSLQEPLQM